MIMIHFFLVACHYVKVRRFVIKIIGLTKGKARPNP